MSLRCYYKDLKTRGPHTDLKVFLEIACKLQTACFCSLAALDQKMRLNELYLVIGGLGGQEREISPKMIQKPAYIKLKKHSYENIPKVL